MAFYSSGVEYGIHSLMCMVDSKGEGREMSVREIAELQGVPYDYLTKIFTKFSKAKLVESSEGKGGGFRLAKPADQITVLDLVRRMLRKAPDVFPIQIEEWIDHRRND
ncbi:RrF2 family transcriptional regulator [Serratia fonticola]